MSDLEIRRAREDELPAVGDLTVAAYLTDALVEPGGGYLAVLADAAQRHRDATLLVATGPDGALLGTVTVCEAGTPFSEVSRPGEMEFRTLAVAPGARGRGVGAALVREVLRRADDLGAQRVVLSSAVTMHAAHRLYRRLGFVRLPERDWQPVPGLQLLAFTLELAEGRGAEG